MAYNELALLVDVNGRPIPQYYDIVNDEFKPLGTMPMQDAAVKAELELLKAELATIKANQTSGDQKVTLSGANVAKTYLPATNVDTGYDNRVSTGWIATANSQVVITATFEPGGTQDFELWVEWGAEAGGTLIPLERVFKTTSDRRGTVVIPVRGSRFIVQVRNYGPPTTLRGLDVVQTPGDHQVSIVGRRALTGDLGDALSYVLDEDGIPVLRVIDAAPVAYDKANNALRILPVYVPNIEIHRVLDFEVSGTSGNIGRFSLLGYSHYYVLVRSNVAHNFKIETYGAIVGGTFGEQATAFETVLGVESGTRGVSTHLAAIGQDQFFRITRGGSEPAARYDVVIYGVV